MNGEVLDALVAFYERQKGPTAITNGDTCKHLTVYSECQCVDRA